MGRQGKLNLVAYQYKSFCTKCVLHECQVNKNYGPLPGRWSPVQPIEGNGSIGMIVGMNPNHNRDGTAITMGSRAATRWIRMIQETINLDSWWITNAVKCSSENNQVERLYVLSCLPWLWEEIAIVQPKLIIASGRDAVDALFAVMGHSIDRTFGETDPIPVVGLYHFSYTIRTGRLTIEQKRLIDIMTKSNQGMLKVVHETVSMAD